MSLLNAVLRRAVDAALSPFAEVSPLVGLGLVSLVVAVGMLLVFKRTSNQEALESVKRQIQACLFEIRLYNDDLRAILGANAEIMRWNLRYLGLSLVPLAWMLVPLVLLIAQLEFHYGYRGLGPGEAALVTAELKEAGEAKPAAVLAAPAGLRVETPSLWVPGDRELAWRIRAERAGRYELTLTVGGATETKTVVVSEAVVRRSPVRVSPGFIDQLFYPAEPPLAPASPVRSIEVAYPPREVEVLGWGLHWMVVFFVLSIVFAFALRRPLGVTI